MMYTTLEVRDDLWDSVWDLVDSKINIELSRTIADDTYYSIIFINHEIKNPITRELKDAVA